jgi:hypothetical protein
MEPENDDKYFVQLNDGWYFYDETWSDVVGPYPTKEVARKMLDRYVARLEGQEVPSGEE